MKSQRSKKRRVVALPKSQDEKKHRGERWLMLLFFCVGLLCVTEPLLSDRPMSEVRGGTYSRKGPISGWGSFTIGGIVMLISACSYYASVKKRPNQPLQRNASTGPVSNFESPARRG